MYGTPNTGVSNSTVVSVVQSLGVKTGFVNETLESDDSKVVWLSESLEDKNKSLHSENSDL